MIDVIAHLADVRARPSFRAFAAVLGHRAEHGRSLSALRMLTAIGASPRLAFEIVDGWPSGDDLRLPSLEPGEEAACRLACFIDDLSAYDWPRLLTAAVGGSTGGGASPSGSSHAGAWGSG